FPGLSHRLEASTEPRERHRHPARVTPLRNSGKSERQDLLGYRIYGRTLDLLIGTNDSTRKASGSGHYVDTPVHGLLLLLVIAQADPAYASLEKAYEAMRAKDYDRAIAA